MLKFLDSDLVSLEKFPLKWRWTDERWNLLPSELIKQIQPFTVEKAAQIWEIQNKYLFHYGLNTEFFEKEEMIRTELTDFSLVQNWLKNRISIKQNFIIVSWTKSLAVKTTSEIFCDYWDDFCYPSSDDVSVSPINLSWLLFYQHSEYFCFGKLKEEFIQ